MTGKAPSIFFFGLFNYTVPSNSGLELKPFTLSSLLELPLLWLNPTVDQGVDSVYSVKESRSKQEPEVHCLSHRLSRR